MINTIYDKYIENLKIGGYVLPPYFIIHDIITTKFPVANQTDIHFDNLTNYYKWELNSIEWFTGMLNRHKHKFSDTDEMLVYMNNKIDNDQFIVFLYSTLLNMSVTIHYPIISITNSRGENHTIQDLYVLLQFEKSGRLFDFKITRGTLSIKEMKNNYVHSHTNNYTNNVRSLQIMGSVCLGSGAFNTAKNVLSNIVDEDTFDEMIVWNFLTQLDNFLTWESLEGTPFRYIDSIHNPFNTSTLVWEELNTNIQLLYHFEKTTIRKLVHEHNILDIITQHPSFKVIPTTEDNISKYKVTVDKRSILKLMYDIPNIEYVPSNKAIIKRDPLGNYLFYRYYTENTNDREDKNTYLNRAGTVMLNFRGNDVKLNVIDDTENEGHHEEIVAHPKILKIILNYIETNINIYYAYNEFENSPY